jgi:hypothetical protein
MEMKIVSSYSWIKKDVACLRRRIEPLLLFSRTRTTSLQHAHMQVLRLSRKQFGRLDDGLTTFFIISLSS